MEAAKGDPLRAQEIEQRLTGTWYWRWWNWRLTEQEHEKKLAKKRR